MQGNHHTLAENFDHYTVVVNFLQDGLLPQAQPVPSRRDAWLRFKLLNKRVKISGANFKSYDSRGLPNKQYNFCCKLRSGLYSQAGYYTVVLEDVEAGNYYAFMPYGGRDPLLIKAKTLMNSKRPVLMQVFDLDVATAPPAEDRSENQMPQSESGMP